MEVAVREEAKGREPSLVRELYLDKYPLSRIDWNGLVSFLELEVLTLNGVGLTTLENFPSLPKLKKLELRDNKISGGLDFLVDARLQNLVYLNLSGNHIGKISELEPLSNLVKLERLDLSGCSVTNTPDYQATIFSFIPSLKALDRFYLNCNGFYEEDDDDESTQEFEDMEHKQRPKTKPPPQKGKLFNTNIRRESLYESDLKHFGNSYSNPISIDLDGVVSNVQQHLEYAITVPVSEPKSSPPSAPSNVGSSDVFLEEPRASDITLKLLEDPVASEDESSDEDFDPSEESNGAPDSGESEGESEPEDQYSEGEEGSSALLKRTRDEDESESEEEHSAKKIKQ